MSSPWMRWAAFLFACVTSGCAPSTYDACIAEATNKPTEVGVKLAQRQCHEKFVRPQQAIDEAKAVERAESFPERWKQTGVTLRTPKELALAFGEPMIRTGPAACAALENTAPPKGRCMTYMWQDKRSGRVCGQLLTVSSECYFRVEILDATDAVWAAWAESY